MQSWDLVKQFMYQYVSYPFQGRQPEVTGVNGGGWRWVWGVWGQLLKPKKMTWKVWWQEPTSVAHQQPASSFET